MPADIVCLSHLRWNFVYQRPNHLMAHAARDRRVFFVEEPERRGTSIAHMDATAHDGVMVVRPILPDSTSPDEDARLSRELLDGYLAEENVHLPWLWYYTPMALPWSAGVRAEAVIYDCMDELSGFKFAPARIRELERELMRRADVVFAGGRTLYDAKRRHHANAHLFPSSVDRDHFGRAREALPDPADQEPIAHPRIGYFGVIDERIDLDLIRDVADMRPDWQFVMVGPLAKITEADLPRAANLHWLGGKSYAELPAYLSGWDVAIMPFALNEATLHISPTKTPEYLSGGRPVVSTPINDVVHPYGDERLVNIAADTESFVAAISVALDCDRAELMARADKLLNTQSWDATWAGMQKLVNELRPRASRRGQLTAPWSTDVGNQAPAFAPLSGSVSTARPR